MAILAQGESPRSNGLLRQLGGGGEQTVVGRLDSKPFFVFC